MGKGSQHIPVVRLPVNKNADVKAVYQDARWETFARLYNEQGRYVPQIPNWTPVRQVAAEGFNCILPTGGSDIPGELKTLDGKVNVELKNKMCWLTEDIGYDAA